MKKNIFIKGFAGLAMAAAASMTPALTSCSSDYLQLSPLTALSPSIIGETVDGAKAAYVGMCNAMYLQMSFGQDSGSGYRWVNGEPWMRWFYGDVYGQDSMPYIWYYSDNYCAWWINRGSMRTENTWSTQLGWCYYYGLINRANYIIGNIDNIPAETDAEKEAIKFYKAGALTVRAHCWQMLLATWAPRWEDSNNGNIGAIIVRTENGTEPMPFSTMNEAYTQLYQDLDDAIALYQSTTMTRSKKWEPNIDVARGIYARAALAKHDYPKAQAMAKLARASYPIMTAAEYCGGFAEENGEWMWANALQSEGIYYWAFGSSSACNGNYGVGWGGSTAINYDLYRMMSETDVRRDLFLTPELIDKYAPTYSSTSKGSDMWSTKTISQTLVKLNTSSTIYKTFVKNYGQSKDCMPNGVAGSTTNKFGKGAYLTNPFVTTSSAVAANIQFGAQYKFWGTDTYGTDQFPYMRGAEMLLIEAEAAYYNSDATTANACLNELNIKRDPQYSFSGSGDALLAEIKRSRRLELWGEGFSFYDYKRWNEDIVKREWVKDDPTSGNFRALAATTLPANKWAGWAFPVPRGEFTYNPEANRAVLINRNEPEK